MLNEVCGCVRRSPVLDWIGELFCYVGILKGVYVVVDVEVFGNGEGEDLLLDGGEGLAHTVDGCVEFDFEHEFADVEGLDAGNWGAVGTKHTVAKDSTETVTHVGGKVVEQAVVAVTEVDVDEAAEGGILE